MSDSFQNWLKKKAERRRPGTPKERWKRLNREAPTAKIENEVYRRESPKFLLAHPRCQFVGKGGARCKRRSSQVHHRRGRGRWLLVKKWWMAICAPHHRWAHDNAREAEALGVIVRDWNVPKDSTLPE